MGEARERFRVLVHEMDPLVAQRLQQMARAEGYATCAVDSMALFHSIRAATEFELFAIGVRDERELDAHELDGSLAPLVLLVPLGTPSAAAHFRLAVPHAMLLDRGLRDPDSLRRVLDDAERAEPPAAALDAVRHAFAPFGLSERQLEVLGSALMGETSRSIAAKLYISELTVRNHLHAIYERVGVSGRRELLGRFVQGLIEGTA